MDKAMLRLSITEFAEAHFASASPLMLKEDEIHLWRVFTTKFHCLEKALEELLSGEEASRMKRFYFPKDRMRFTVAHGILRILTGRYLNLSPRLVEFRAHPNGKPAVDACPAEKSLFFNISHSHEMVVLAFAKFPQIGVDVEFIRPMPDFQELADVYFHTEEKRGLHGTTAGERHKAFFECWTRKEAFVKATGEGLSRPLDSFFTFADDTGTDGIYRIGGRGISPGNWILTDFTPALGYAGAVAFELESSQRYEICKIWD